MVQKIETERVWEDQFLTTQPGERRGVAWGLAGFCRPLIEGNLVGLMRRVTAVVRASAQVHKLWRCFGLQRLVCCVQI